MGQYLAAADFGDAIERAFRDFLLIDACHLIILEAFLKPQGVEHRALLLQGLVFVDGGLEALIGRRQGEGQHGA